MLGLTSEEYYSHYTVTDKKVIYLGENNPFIGLCGHRPSQGSLKIFWHSEKLDVILVLCECKNVGDYKGKMHPIKMLFFPLYPRRVSVYTYIVAQNDNTIRESMN